MKTRIISMLEPVIPEIRRESCFSRGTAPAPTLKSMTTLYYQAVAEKAAARAGSTESLQNQSESFLRSRASKTVRRR